MQVLVVDDEPEIRHILASYLGVEGYQVTTAADGAEALACIERDSPSLVVLDMRMPVMDGWDFAREVHNRGLDVPIMVMTAAGDAQRCAEEIRASSYVSKPVNLRQLIEKVDRLCA